MPEHIPDETEHIEQLAAIITARYSSFDPLSAAGIAEAIHAAGYVSAEVASARMADAWDEGYGDDAECNEPRKNPYRATEEPS